MVYTIEEIKNLVAPIIRKYNIPAMFLFGSYARGKADESSDLDFLVDTSGATLTSLIKLGALYCDLEELFGKHIDLLTVSSITQESMMPSDVEFKKAVIEELIQLNEFR